MKALKETVRKYYKYIVTPWTQPILSADGTLGGSSFAVYADKVSSGYGAWKAVDGDASDFYNTPSTPVNYIFYNPNPLKVSSILMTNHQHNYTVGIPTGGTVYGSNDNSSYTSLATFTNSNTTMGSQWTLTVNSSSSYKYYKLNVTKQNGSGGMSIGEMTLSATEQDVIESTSSDYDFYKDVEEYKTVKKTIRKYYKYINTPWTQPVLSANGTLGGDSFAVAASSTYSSSNQAYHAFDNNATTSFYANGSPYSITFYNPTPIKVSRLLIANRDQNNSCIKTGYVSGSKDGINYTKLCDFTNSNYASYGTWTINVNSSDGYNYYMLYASTAFGSYSGVSNINITAVTQIIEESDSSDYDFYVDNGKYKAAKI